MLTQWRVLFLETIPKHLLRYESLVMPSPLIEFRKVQSKDVTLVRSWLKHQHVRRWWNEAWSAPVLDGLEHGTGVPEWIDSYVVKWDSLLIGYIQARRALGDPGGYWKNVDDVTGATIAVDFLIGEGAQINRKLGRVMLNRFTGMLFNDPDIDRIVSAPQRDNWPANIALKRAGFRDRGAITKPGVNCMFLSLARSVYKAI